MDVADDLAEAFERGLVKISGRVPSIGRSWTRKTRLRTEDDSDAEDADVVEEIDDTDEPEDTA